MENQVDPALAETQETPEAETEVEVKAEPKAEPAPAPDDAEVKGIQRRIDELTRLRREAERDRDHWRDMAIKGQPRAEVQPEAPKTLADFQYDEAKYQAYLFSTAETRAVEAAEKRLREQMQQENVQRRTQSFVSRETAFAKTAPDYYEVTRSDTLPISPAMAEAIAESEEGPALAYHLGKNQEIAEQIARLSPLAQARELGRIEARLIADREKPKPVTKAPPPAPKIEAVEPSISVPADDAASDKLSDAEWLKRREKQLRKRAS